MFIFLTYVFYLTDLPDAYKGKSEYMEDIMDWLITRTDEW